MTLRSIGDVLREGDIVYGPVTTIPTHNGIRHKVYDIEFRTLPEGDFELRTDYGAQGHILNLHVQPLGQHFSVVWNGDRDKPVLSFDGIEPGIPFKIRLTLWGK